MNWIIIIIFILSISFFLITKYYYLKKTLENENLEAFETEIALTPTQKLLNTAISLNISSQASAAL